MQLSSINASILAPIQARIRQIAEGLNEDDQADLLELDIYLRNEAFRKLRIQASPFRKSRRLKVVPRFS